MKVWPEATFSSQIGQGRASGDDVTAKAAAAIATAAAEMGGPPPSDFYRNVFLIERLILHLKTQIISTTWHGMTLTSLVLDNMKFEPSISRS